LKEIEREREKCDGKKKRLRCDAMVVERLEVFIAGRRVLA